MPAIRHRSGAVFRVAKQLMEKNHMVEIIRRDGSLVPVTWLGFICNAGTCFLNGALAKMEAFEISADDGSSLTNWTRVPKGEHVLCWRVNYSVGSAKCGVYGIVDDFGMPLITGTSPDRNLRTTEALKYNLDNKNSLKIVS